MAAAPGQGTTIGAGYILQDVLGDEILGTVWRATAPNDAGSVRVKLLRPDGDNERVHRFQREAEAVGRLRHPSLVRLLDQGEHEGVPFLVFDHDEARPLDAILREGPLDPERAVHLALAVAQGLAAVHREGVVHRNLTAANVLVLEGDAVKLRDFGLAAMVGGEVPTQLTRDEARIGSVVAMSPEYAAEAAIGPKGDVYALGVLLYQATTGRPPFEGRDALARKVMERPARPSTVRPGIPSWVDALALQLLAADPAERPEIDEVIARFEHALRAHRAAQPTLPRSILWPGLLAAALALAAALSSVAVVFRTVAAPAEPVPPPAAPIEVAAAPNDEVPLEPTEAPPVVDLPPAVTASTAARPVVLELVGMLRIRSNRRVLVEVDGSAVGFAPLNVRVPRGAHLVTVALPARPDTIREETAHVVKGSDLTLKFVF